MENSNSLDARSFYLEGWDGSGDGFSYDTFTHGHVRCGSLCLSVLGAIQPSPLASLVASAQSGKTTDDGLLQRFQLMVYPDQKVNWEYQDSVPNDKLKAKIEDIFEQVAGINGVFKFNAEAQSLFVEWYSNLMSNLTKEPNPSLESHFAKYGSLMPSLALLFHLVDCVSCDDVCVQDISLKVDKESVEKAIDFTNLLESHARRIYGMGALAGVDAANKILDMVDNGRLSNPFARGELLKKKLSGLKEAKQVKKAISLLEDFGWVQIEIKQTGGRPSELCHVYKK